MNSMEDLGHLLILGGIILTIIYSVFKMLFYLGGWLIFTGFRKVYFK